ncbi:MAG: hypothetical protein OEM59_21320 [Rhodospirillales bacterium]|nr:hypothetical protein [Rhodospirillales bacterium]
MPRRIISAPATPPEDFSGSSLNSGEGASDLAHKLIVGVEAMGHAPDGLNRFACVMHRPLNPTRNQVKNHFSGPPAGVVFSPALAASTALDDAQRHRRRAAS